MHNWKIKSFKEIAQFPPKVSLKKGIPYSFIPMETIDGVTKYASPNQEKVWSGSGGAKFEDGDTLFARITPCLQNGKIAQAKNLNNGFGFGSTEYFIFRGIEGVSDTNFIYYLSKTDGFRQNAIGSMVGASGRQRADASFVGQYQVSLPSLSTQTKIGNILSAYDDLIANNLKRIKLLEEMAQITYKEWFVRMRFPNNDHTSTDSVRSNSPFLTKKFEDLFTIKNGFAFKSEDYRTSGVKILRTKDYSQSKYIRIEQPIYLSNEDAIKYSKFYVKPYDLMLIMVGASIGSFGLVLPKDQGILQNQNQWAIRAKNQIHEFYKLLMMESLIKSLMVKKTGAARDFFRASFLNEMLIQIPPDEIIEKFNTVVAPIFQVINNLFEQNSHLEKSRDILLPRLMSGMIDTEGLAAVV